MPASIPPEARRSRAELLADVQRRGRALRRRRKIVTAVSTLAVTALVFGISDQLASGRSSVQVTTAGQGQVSNPQPEPTATTAPDRPATTTSGPTSDNAPAATTTTMSSQVSSASRRPGSPLSTTTSSTKPLASTTTTSATTATTATTVTTASGPTTTTELVCWKSYDPRCGEFHWDPAPSVDPMTASVSLTTTSPRAGQPVTFKLVADNPDTNISPCVPTNFGDGSPEAVCSGFTYPCSNEPQATGAWPPPQKQPGHFENTSQYTYQKPGTYTATFYFWTGFPGCQSPADKDPYRNKANATITFTIQP